MDTWEESISKVINAKVSGLRTCDSYFGQLANLERISFSVPAVFVANLGWAPAAEKSGVGSQVVKVRFAAYVISKAADKKRSAGQIALEISQLLHHQNFNLGGLGLARLERAQPGVNTMLAKNKMHLWAVTWHQDLLGNPAEAGTSALDRYLGVNEEK